MGNWSPKERHRRDIARFWLNTKIEGNCIIWTGQLNKDGYGKFTTTVYPKNQTHHLAHRWIYQQVNGILSKKELVLHTCDNPACVKLQHLDKGDEGQNAIDMMNRGRGAGQFMTGSAHPNALLTEDQVREIKKLLADGQSISSIASLFCLTPSAIRDIHKGKNWRQVK